MASEKVESETPDSPQVQANSWTKEDKKNNKKLRHAGLEYVSRSGRTIAAKKQPDVICNCPQQCSIKVPKEIQQRLFEDFYALADASSQNAYLQRLIEIRSVNKRLYKEERKESGRLQRRVTCKYRVPLKLPPKNLEATSTTNGNQSQNNISIENEDAPMPSEESDNDEDRLEIGEELDEREVAGEKSKNETAAIVQSTPELAKKEGSDIAEATDDKENENSSNENQTENVESSQQNGTKELKQLPGTEVTGIKLQTEEQKANFSTEDKVMEAKSETSITSMETDSKTSDPVSVNTQTASTNTVAQPAEQKDVVEICQKAFMNIFTITEKRVRLQRERIIDELRYLAEKRQAEQEEMENTISVARELAAGCRPLLNFMDKSNEPNRIPSLPNKLLMAIDNDITLVNNFFRNQLWKPEHFSKRYKCDDLQSEADILD